MILSLVIVCLVLITEIATWWYDHRTEQKNNTLPSHGIEPCTSCFPGRRINHCTRKECWSFVSFRLMFEGEHFEHNRHKYSTPKRNLHISAKCWLNELQILPTVEARSRCLFITQMCNAKALRFQIPLKCKYLDSNEVMSVRLWKHFFLFEFDFQYKHSIKKIVLFTALPE